MLLHQRHRRLLTDAGNARDVVRDIALQGLEVGHQRRFEAEALTHPLGVIDDGLGDAATGGVDAHVLVDQLQGVEVAGEDEHVQPPLHRAAAQRADDVIGLVSGQLHQRDAQRGADIAAER